MHGIRATLDDQARAVLRQTTVSRDARRSDASVASKASRASSPVKGGSVKSGRARLSVSFAPAGFETASVKGRPTAEAALSPGYRDEAFSFSAISNDWSRAPGPNQA